MRCHYEPPHQDLRCLQIQLFSSLVVKELNTLLDPRKGLAVGRRKLRLKVEKKIKKKQNN